MKTAEAIAEIAFLMRCLLNYVLVPYHNASSNLNLTIGKWGLRLVLHGKEISISYKDIKARQEQYVTVPCEGLAFTIDTLRPSQNGRQLPDIFRYIFLN